MVRQMRAEYTRTSLAPLLGSEPSTAPRNMQRRPHSTEARRCTIEHTACRPYGSAVATEVQSHAARRRWWPCDTIWQRPQCKVRPRSDAFARRFDMGVAREARPDAPFCTLTNAVWCTPMVRPGSFVAMPCHALCLAKHCLAFPCTRRTSVALPSFTAPLPSGPDASRAGFSMRV
jgi:hypothetical protein